MGGGNGSVNGADGSVAMAQVEVHNQHFGVQGDAEGAGNAVATVAQQQLAAGVDESEGDPTQRLENQISQLTSRATSLQGRACSMNRNSEKAKWFCLASLVACLFFKFLPFIGAVAVVVASGLFVGAVVAKAADVQDPLIEAIISVPLGCVGGSLGLTKLVPVVLPVFRVLSVVFTPVALMTSVVSLVTSAGLYGYSKYALRQSVAANDQLLESQKQLTALKA